MSTYGYPERVDVTAQWERDKKPEATRPRICELPGCERPKHFLLCQEHFDKLPESVRQELFAAWDAQKEPTKRWMRARWKALEAVK